MTKALRLAAVQQATDLPTELVNLIAEYDRMLKLSSDTLTVTKRETYYGKKFPHQFDEWMALSSMFISPYQKPLFDAFLKPEIDSKSIRVPSPNGRYVLAAGSKVGDHQPVSLYDSKSCVWKRLGRHKYPIMSLACSNNKAASGGFNKKIRIWNLNQATYLFKEVDTENWVYALKFFEKGLKLVAASHSEIQIWNVESYVLTQKFTTAHTDIFSLHVSRENLLLTVGAWPTLAITNLNDQQMIYESHLQESKGAYAIAVSKDEQTVIVGTATQAITLKLQ